MTILERPIVQQSIILQGNNCPLIDLRHKSALFINKFVKTKS